MKDAFTGAALDAPWVGTGGLLLLGVQVEWWIAAMALAYGLIRLISAGIDLHWKLKDRRDKENRNNGDDGNRPSPDRRNAD